MMYLLAGLAFLFYIAKFPEVVLPGRWLTMLYLLQEFFGLNSTDSQYIFAGLTSSAAATSGGTSSSFSASPIVSFFCHLCQAFDRTVHLAGYLIFALSLITIIYVCHLNKHPHRLAGYTTGVALSQYRAAGSCNQVGLLGTCAQSLWLLLYHSTI